MLDMATLKGWNLLMAEKDVTSTRVWGFLPRTGGGTQPQDIPRLSFIPKFPGHSFTPKLSPLPPTIASSNGKRAMLDLGSLYLAESRLPNMQ